MVCYMHRGYTREAQSIHDFNHLREYHLLSDIRLAVRAQLCSARLQSNTIHHNIAISAAEMLRTQLEWAETDY